MKVLSSGIVDGWFEDRFGSRGSEFIYDVVPSRSIPFEIINRRRERYLLHSS